ncbi:hypothetical protein MRB53_026284 [Persea americana]|uniref:Uncharacterized protein n=1 Tax=Persea americana TaxID=3435 RepID=A0ACC2LHX6_PERAE|nr:hypothetical protein MRB53_026284 [Persea americana]
MHAFNLWEMKGLLTIDPNDAVPLRNMSTRKIPRVTERCRLTAKQSLFSCSFFKEMTKLFRIRLHSKC